MSRLGNRRQGPPRLMGAVQRCQHVRGQALDTEGDACKTTLAQVRQHRRIHRIRISLRRDLGTRCQPELLRDGIEDAHQIRSTQQGRGPPTDEDSLDGPIVSDGGARKSNLGDHRVGICAPRRPRPQFLSRVGVEITISATGGAEGDVHVHTEGSRRWVARIGQHSSIVPVMTCHRHGGRRTLRQHPI